MDDYFSKLKSIEKEITKLELFFKNMVCIMDCFNHPSLVTDGKITIPKKDLREFTRQFFLMIIHYQNATSYN